MAGHEIKIEAGVNKTGESVLKFCRLHRRLPTFLSLAFDLGYVDDFTSIGPYASLTHNNSTFLITAFLTHSTPFSEILFQGKLTYHEL